MNIAPTLPRDAHRQDVMKALLACYAGEPARRVVRVAGVESSFQRKGELLRLLWEWSRRQQAGKGDAKERPNVDATAYMILRSPLEFGKKDSAKAVAAARKLERHREIWQLAHQAVEQVDFAFARRYTALAVTHNFIGSPHIDTTNIGPFMSMGLGSYEAGTGQLCVESGVREVSMVDTKGRFAKVDGRFPHWVAPFEGDRFSLVYYVTEGDVEPRSGSAVLPIGTVRNHV